MAISSSIISGIFDSINTASTNAWNHANMIAGQKHQKALQEDSQAFTAEQQEDSQTFNAEQAELTRRYNAAEAEKARDFQEQFYEKYSSPKAQISSAMEAGVNPFGLAGSGSGPTVSTSPASSGAASSSPAGAAGVSSSPLARISNILPSIFEMIMEKKSQDRSDKVAESDISRNEAEAEYFRSSARNLDKETSWIDRINELDLDRVRSEISKNESEVDRNLQAVKEFISNISVNDKRIELMGADIELRGAEKELAATKAAVEKLNAQQLELLMPYIQARQEADIAYTTAKTNEAQFSAEKQMYDANMSMLKVMVEADLIDKGYYDSLVKEAQWSAAMAKREYKWKPVNDVCSNVSKIAIGVGSVLSGVASLKGVPAPAPAPAPSPASLTFF